MKILVLVLSMAIIMLPHFLQSFVSSTIVNSTVFNAVPLIAHIAIAQNGTFASTNTDTGTGISAGASNVTTESDVANTGNPAVALPPRAQQLQEHSIEQKKPI